MPTLSSARRRRFAKGDCLRRSPNAWLSVCSAALVLLAAGCGGDSSSSDSQGLDPAVAEQLADRSDAVAAAIEANDGCAAAERARELRAAVAEAAGRGEVPQPIRREVERVAARDFVCPELAPPTELRPPPAEPPSDDEGKRKEGNKEKKHDRDVKGDDD